MSLRIVPVGPDSVGLWRDIHNAVIPAHQLTSDDAMLAEARGMGARRIETVVLASNEDGLAFASRHGFVESDRYAPDGETATYVDLYLVS